MHVIFMSEEDRESLSKVRQSFAQAGRKTSLVDNAYVALKEVIRDGVLPAGYQGSEQEIAGELNMSRTPVHEAIIRLQSEGLALTPRPVIYANDADDRGQRMQACRCCVDKPETGNCSD
jgi:hypothetical protein